MSFLTNVLTLLNWHLRRQRRTSRYGGNDSVSESADNPDDSDQDDTNDEHPGFGLEFVAERAADHEPQPQPYHRKPPMETQFFDYMLDHQDGPRVEAYPTAFQDGIVLTDGTPGGWIIANDGSYRDRRTMQ